MEPKVAKYLHMKGSQLGLPIGGTFELTPRCNFNCKMCYVHLTQEEQERRGRELTTEEWLRIGKDAKDAGMVFLLLTGGEPTTIDRFDKTAIETPYPNAVFLREGPLHEYAYKKYRYTFFVIYNPSLEYAMRSAGVRLTSPPWSIHDPDAVNESVKNILKLVKEVQKEPNLADEIDALCWALVAKLCRDMPETELDPVKMEPIEQPTEPEIYAVLREVDQNCCKEIDFAKLAQKYGMTYRTFLRRWVAFFGKTPTQLLRERRLMRAVAFLECTNYPVNYIARSVGYKDAGHFARLFQQVYGMMPLAYRKAKH